MTDSSSLHQKFQKMVKQTVVVFPVGGTSSRIQHIAKGKHKSLIVLPNGQTMIGRKIRMYQSLGYQHFVLMTSHKTDNQFREYLGDSAKSNVQITYSVSGEEDGKGTKVYTAMQNECISADDYVIIDNPDDAICHTDTQSVLQRALNSHISHEEEGAMGTVLAVKGVHYPYGALTIANNNVAIDFTRDLIVQVPTPMGVSVYSPGITNYFDDLFAGGKTNEFERVLFERLIAEKKLYVAVVPECSWIPVNDHRGWEEFLRYLGSEK